MNNILPIHVKQIDDKLAAVRPYTMQLLHWDEIEVIREVFKEWEQYKRAEIIAKERESDADNSSV